MVDSIQCLVKTGYDVILNKARTCREQLTTWIPHITNAELLVWQESASKFREIIISKMKFTAAPWTTLAGIIWDAAQSGITWSHQLDISLYISRQGQDAQLPHEQYLPRKQNTTTNSVLLSITIRWCSLRVRKCPCLYYICSLWTAKGCHLDMHNGMK